MKKYTQEELEVVLAKHKKWLSDEEGGEKADLSYAVSNLKFISLSCIGSRKGMTTYCFDNDTIWCGCFKGTLQEFEEKVNKEHKDNKQYLKEYIGAINYIKFLKEV